MQEMYAFSMALFVTGVKHVDLHLNFMAQPPWDKNMELSPGKPYYILHYTYGNDFKADGSFTPGARQWRRRRWRRLVPSAVGGWVPLRPGRECLFQEPSAACCAGLADRRVLWMWRWGSGRAGAAAHNCMYAGARVCARVRRKIWGVAFRQAQLRGEAAAETFRGTAGEDAKRHGGTRG